MTRLKRLRFVLLTSTILLAGVILVFVSCAPAAPVTAPPAELETALERMPPAILVIPNIGTPRQKVDYVGANFEPGEEVMVATLMFPDVETNLSGGAEGLTTKVDDLGSFQIKGKKLSLYPGVYPVRVYDKDGKMIASTLVVVEEKK